MRLFASRFLSPLNKCRRLSFPTLTSSPPNSHPTFLKNENHDTPRNNHHAPLHLRSCHSRPLHLPIPASSRTPVKTTPSPRYSSMLKTSTIKVAVTTRDSVPQVREEQYSVRITFCTGQYNVEKIVRIRGIHATVDWKRGIIIWVIEQELGKSMSVIASTDNLRPSRYTSSPPNL
jgi:hypothetical protein